MLLALCTVLGENLQAEPMHYLPRLRQIQDLVKRATGSRYNDKRGALGNSEFSAGLALGYTSDYYWRGFQLFDSDLLMYGDGYVNIYGVEASVYGLMDFGSERQRPKEMDYRLRYQFEIEGTIVSVGYCFYDFSGSDGGLGKKDQGFGNQGKEVFPDNRFPSGIQEVQLHMTYFTSVLQQQGVNLQFAANIFQRIDDEGTRIETSVTLFVDNPTFTIFGDYFSLTTTDVYQHRYLTNRSGFQGQTTHARIVYNLEKYRMAPLFIVLEAIYYAGFHKDLVDGFYFGVNVNLRF
ncbi:MAG: hypothetical protein IT462_05305 [Planctomycetes bacterium]|nr:hypothetical protein [Planctomycetota bacterium]